MSLKTEHLSIGIGHMRTSRRNTQMPEPRREMASNPMIPAQLPNVARGMRRSGTAQAVSRRRLGCLVVVACLLTCFGAVAQERLGNAPLGLWRTQGGGIIETFRCGRGLCGRIVGIPRAPGEPIPKDSAGRSQCGLTIMTGVVEGQDGSWSGHITDPRDGAQYHVKLWVDNRGSLNVRGYILLPLLGQTQVWHRYTGRVGPQCTLA